jgi:hypothetical protein
VSKHRVFVCATKKEEELLARAVVVRRTPWWARLLVDFVDERGYRPKGTTSPPRTSCKSSPQDKALHRSCRPAHNIPWRGPRARLLRTLPCILPGSGRVAWSRAVPLSLLHVTRKSWRVGQRRSSAL